MSQQPNGIVNGPAEYNTTIKDEIINKDTLDIQHKEQNESDPQTQNMQHQQSSFPTPTESTNSPNPLATESSVELENLQLGPNKDESPNHLPPKIVEAANPIRPLQRIQSRSSFNSETKPDENYQLPIQQHPIPPQPARPINPQRPLARTESRSSFQVGTMEDGNLGQLPYQQYSYPPEQSRAVNPQKPLNRNDSRSSFYMTGAPQGGDLGPEISYAQNPQPYRPVNPQRPMLRVGSRSTFQTTNTQQNENQYQYAYYQSSQPPQPSGPMNPLRPLVRVDSRSTFQPPYTQNGPLQLSQPPQSSQPGAFINQARPLTRIDSRSSIPFRPPFPNQPLRPGQVRQPQPGVQPQLVQRPPIPGSVQRPPTNQGPPASQVPPTQPFPQNPQNRANFRPPAPFPRPPVQNQRPPGLSHQRSVPAFNIRPQIQEEGLSRSQTLDTTEIDYSNSPDDNKKSNDHIKGSSTAAMNNRSYSLNMNPPESPNEALDEQRRRSTSSVYGLREGRPSSAQSSISGSTESLDKKQENEVPSRPESRSTSRMNMIAEDEGRHRSSLTDVSQKSGDTMSDSTGDKSQPTISDINDSTNSNKSQRTENIKPQSLSPKPPIPKPKSHNPQPSNPASQVANISHQNSKVEKEKLEDASHKNVKSSSVESREGSKKPTRHLELEKPPKAKSPARSEGDNDSGVDESTQGNDPSSNGENRSPRKSSKTRTSSTTPTGRSLSRGSKSPSLKSPDSNVTTPGSATEKKKLPMNKIQVGSAPSPNLKVVRSKIGSLDNASYKPGGGKVKIETKKLDFKAAAPRIEAKNDKYVPKGGEKKIVQQKLQWNAKSKIGSLENATYKPKGGEKKIETMKLDFKEKAKPKVGSKDNLKHQPGGGDIKSEDTVETKQSTTEKDKSINNVNKIENKKIDLKVNSKVGSLDNVKYRPGGGDKKIFDDKDYLKQKSAVPSIDHSLSGSQQKKVQIQEPEVIESPVRATPRILDTVEEEETLTSGRFSRCGSARRKKSAESPRPKWKI